MNWKQVLVWAAVIVLVVVGWNALKKG